MLYPNFIYKAKLFVKENKGLVVHLIILCDLLKFTQESYSKNFYKTGLCLRFFYLQFNNWEKKARTIMKFHYVIGIIAHLLI